MNRGRMRKATAYRRAGAKGKTFARCRACVVISVLLIAWSTMVRAQQSLTLVVPNAMATTEGNIGNSFPFNIGTNTLRYQQVYASSQFGAMPPGGALITGIAFRADAGWGSFTGSLPAIRIDLSTTAKSPDALDSGFANNVGANNTVVFNGPLPLSSAAGGTC